MSFVITHPEALTYAAGKLQTLGSALAAENAAVAVPTTSLAPAGADEVSGLQAALFAAYGTLYQSVSAQATAIHDLFVNTLGTSAASYAVTEAANSVATTSPLSVFSSTANGNGAQVIPDVFSGGLANIVNIGAGNYSSAASDLLNMAAGGLLSSQEAGLGAAPDQAAPMVPALTGTVPAGLGEGPIAAGLGRAATVGQLSVPPGWAAGPAAPPVGPDTATPAGWTAPPPRGGAVTAVPAGLPTVAAASRAGGLGAPRYGVKPTVMGRPAGV